MLSNIVVLALILLVVGSALAVVLMKNIVHSALFLALFFSGVGGIFILLQADFLAAVQLLIYTGAVAIMVVFGIMFSQQEDMSESNPFSKFKSGAALVAVALFFLGSAMVARSGWQPLTPKVENITTVKEIAILMFTDYVIPFEAAAILLLVAMIGAIILARGVKEAP